jgi:hypothetical protein
MRRARHYADEEKAEPGKVALRSSVRREATPDVQRLVELQRTAGNAAIAAALSNTVVQRDGLKLSDAPLRVHLLDLTGVSSVLCPDPKPPWLPKVGSRPSPKEPSDPDDAAQVWKLDFDLKVDDNSALGQELARAERMRQIMSGGKGDGDTPLGLQLTNAAVNILANTDKGKELASKLYLDRVSVVVDPSSGKYGLTAQFTFGGK